MVCDVVESYGMDDAVDRGLYSITEKGIGEPNNDLQRSSLVMKSCSTNHCSTSNCSSTTSSLAALHDLFAALVLPLQIVHTHSYWVAVTRKLVQNDLFSQEPVNKQFLALSVSRSTSFDGLCVAGKLHDPVVLY